MQHSPHEIKEKLLKALDKDYNVVDMPVVVEIIGILERTPITKEALETTRLGKYVNELRRKTTNEQVAKRAKDLVRKWRDMILPQSNAGSDGGTAGPNQNGARNTISTGKTVSPAFARSLSPGSWNRSAPVSPALSIKRSQPASPASRISSLSPENRVALSPSSLRQTTISPSVSPRPQATISKFNQTVQIPRSSGEPTTISLPIGTTITRAPEQSTSQPIPRPRGRPPLNRSGLDIVKSPPRPRGRPPLDQSDGEAPRGRGRPPLDPSRAEHRGRGRPPLSSPPSGAPRKRGRPPKNKNKLKGFASPPLDNDNSNLVPKNSPANKRLRKSSDDATTTAEEYEDHEESAAEEPALKKQKLNGVYDSKVPEIVNLNEGYPGEVDHPSQVPSEQIKIPKKRGRQKGSKNAPKKLSFDRTWDEDVVKEKMASIVRNPKVKTTRELLECIQKESSLDNLRNRTLSSLGVDGEKSSSGKNSTPSHKLFNKNNDSSDYDMTISKTEHIHKFLRSQNEAEEDYGHRALIDVNDKLESDKSASRPHSRATSEILLSAPVSEASVVHETIDLVDDDIIVDVEKIDSAEEPSPVKAKKCETVEEILAKLPVINHDEILWSESDSESGSSGTDEEEPREVIVTEEDVDDLHNKHIEGVNGNWNDGILTLGLNHGLKVPIGNITNGDMGAKPNSKPNNLTDEGEDRDDEGSGDDNNEIELLDRNLNNLGVNEISHDDNFREWQECVSKTSYNGELLHILPYVIID